MMNKDVVFHYMNKEGTMSIVGKWGVRGAEAVTGSTSLMQIRTS